MTPEREEEIRAFSRHEDSAIDPSIDECAELCAELFVVIDRLRAELARADRNIDEIHK